MAEDYVPAVVPVPGKVVSIVLQIITFGVLCGYFTRRTSWFKHWPNLPLAIWLVLLIYVDSAIFVFATSILFHGVNINSSRSICEGGILVCLLCYMSTKILTYYFLVERAYIVRGSRKSRLKTKLWLFNCLFMMLPYTIFVIMNLIWRFSYINDKGVCIIGMQRKAMLPLIIFEVVVNVYLTMLFVLPLRELYSWKHNINPKLNRMVYRSLIGSLATLTTCVANLTVLMVLKGEPAWICFTCCNADILFCVSVLHWVTSKDKPKSHSYPSERIARNTISGRTGQKSAAADDLTSGAKYTPALSVLEHHPGNCVTTEVIAASAEMDLERKRLSSRALHRSRTAGSENDDEVELHKIHVQSEVSIVHGSCEEEDARNVMQGSNRSGEGTWGLERTVSAERMV